MTRPLKVVAAEGTEPVLEALRAALAGGPAILPLAETSGTTAGLPAEVLKRIAVVIETSGSTGRPKRVALSSDALLASAAASEAALGGPGQWVLALPAHYIAGINVLVRSIAAETEPVILRPGHFDAEAFVAAAATMDAALRFTSVVPAQLARLVAAAEGGTADVQAARSVLQRFDRILVGGQATPPDLLERAAALGLSVTRTYGSSETSGGCVYDGVPIGMAAARIRGGEVLLSGPMLAEEYLGDPALTAERFVMDDGLRWYRTGDAGILIDGVLKVTGRLDRVLISGGIKVSLDDVERVVRALPGLADAVVLPGPSAEWGEVPVIVSTTPVDLGALRGAVVAVLGRAAAPSRVIPVERIPQLPSGKPDREALRSLVEGEATAPDNSTSSP